MLLPVGYWSSIKTYNVIIMLCQTPYPILAFGKKNGWERLWYKRKENKNKTNRRKKEERKSDINMSILQL